jgi:hypothetical protein
MKRIFRYALIVIVSILLTGTAAYLLAWMGIALGLIK